MAKKKNSRKALAVALGIMGIAGLSLASASQLNVTAATNEVAIGVDTFTPCDADGVTVNYAYAADSTLVAPASGYGITNVTVSGIDAACNGKKITLGLADNAGTQLFTTGPTAIGASTTFVYDATSKHVDIQKDLGKVTVIIG